LNWEKLFGEKIHSQERKKERKKVQVLCRCFIVLLGGGGGNKRKKRVGAVFWVWNFAKGLRPQSTQGMSVSFTK
jgi:hypothetical protein